MSSLTYPIFYYGIEITTENNKINFDEGDGELTAEITIGAYTIESLAEEVATQLNATGTFTYGCSVNRATRVLTITSSSATDFDFLSGTHNAATICLIMGFAKTDRVAVTSITGTSAVGSTWSPQFPMQGYVPPEHNKSSAFATVNQSASGNVQVQRFGVRRIGEFEQKFITNIPQPAGAPIKSDTNAEANALAFFDYATEKKPFEFMPDDSDRETYYKVLLESTEDSQDGVGFKLKPMYDLGLNGYFKTGILKIRVID